MAKAVKNSPQDVLSLTKLAEGGSYRIFEATFRNGSQAIARLPYPCTIPQRFGVASEVATMDFLRLHGLPIPRVLDWDSTSANPLGCEYMIIERVHGRELDDIWTTMDMKERFEIVKSIVEVESTLFGFNFPASGSLFYKESLDPSIARVDLPSTMSSHDVSSFCIGPSTELLWWYNKRDSLDVSRGPCRLIEPLSTIHLLIRLLGIDSKDVLTAVGERELAWLRKYGRKR